MSVHTVAVVGLGPMGRALASAFSEGGIRTTVWNRTQARADALVERGAVRAETVLDAVRAAELVVVCLRDDQAVAAVLEPAADALRGRTLVNFTSTAPHQSRTRGEWAARHGIGYLDGAILTPTPTIGGPGALILYSGPEPVYQAHRAVLATLGGRAEYVGEDVGRAAGYDAAVLSLFWLSILGVVHSLAMARAEGISGADLAPFAASITGLLPEMLDRFARQVEADDYPGGISTIASASAGLAHLTESARRLGFDTAIFRASLDIVERAVDSGFGADGLARLTDIVARPTAESVR
ncbi:NAD(P)-binding domain-containing protein [Nocardia xishanensis]|uniref:NAD(P)-dependent oxidoreductase n=1 Tax=Nocardia xishanensis TaxID=238964 RepID=A0ABW7X3B5_9NOCA